MTLQDMRKKAKLSQSELSAVSGIKLRTIQQYESGRRSIDKGKLDTLCTLALACQCSVYDLIEDEQLKIKLKKTT